MSRARSKSPPAPGPARASSIWRRLERSGKRAASRLLVRVSRPHAVSADEIAAAPVQRLLVVRQHNQMGDMVLALPALRALRRAYPEAKLTFVTAPLCEELLRNHPDVDELIVYRKMQMWRPWRLVAFIARLRRLRADLAVVMGTVSFSMTSALLVWASGARLRVGASSAPFGSDLSRAIYHLELPLAAGGVHEVEHNLEPLRAMGIEVPYALPELIAAPDAEAEARAFLAQSFPQRQGPLIVVHPGAGKLPNIWPVECFARLADSLQQEFGAAMVATEGPSDASIVGQLTQRAGAGLKRWRSDLDRTLGLLQHADVVISNDTGMAHVAAAVGAPTVVLFGPTDAQRWKPAGEHVVAIVSRTGAIEGVTVDEVLHATRAQLQRRADRESNSPRRSRTLPLNARPR